jgi:hypothetical protein
MLAAQGHGQVTGLVRRKRPRHIEDDHQLALFKWARMANIKGVQVADYLIAIPNGGKRNAREAGRMKAMGVKAGVSDMLLPIPRGHYHGLWIELKAPDGRVSPEQKAWIEKMVMQGYSARVCFGWEEARIAIQLYLALEKCH